MLRKLLNNQIFRFLICGAVTAAFNILLITLMIELLKLEQPFLRNIANIASIEISLLFSFFVYRTWVWSKGNWTFHEVLWRQIPFYHLVCGSAALIRSVILFPILDLLGINYTINTLIGILVGASVTYIIGDKWLFKAE